MVRTAPQLIQREKSRLRRLAPPKRENSRIAATSGLLKPSFIAGDTFFCSAE
jgi:hypothetical protein